MSEILWAVVRGGVVENVIVADPSFVDLIRSDYDAVVRVDGRPDRPGPGWTYDTTTDVFAPPPDQQP
jgi:hypothetical protein